jgi:hypothetical protein
MIISKVCKYCILKLMQVLNVFVGYFGKFVNTPRLCFAFSGFISYLSRRSLPIHVRIRLYNGIDSVTVALSKALLEGLEEWGELVRTDMSVLSSQNLENPLLN